MAARPSADLMARTEARARIDPDFTDLLSRLVDLPAGPEVKLEAAASGVINDGRRRTAVEEFQKAALTTAEVQKLLGFGTPQAVHRLRSRGRLLGWAIGNQTWFPAWQFDAGAMRPQLPRLLESLRRFTDDPVAADRIMRVVRDDLGGTSLSAVLDSPGCEDLVWAALGDLDG